MLRYSSMLLEVCREISIPSSFITVIALGFTPWLSMPALYTLALSPAKYDMYPSAIWLLQLLPVHKIKILFITNIHLCSHCKCNDFKIITSRSNQARSKHLAFLHTPLY